MVLNPVKNGKILLSYNTHTHGCVPASREDQVKQWSYNNDSTGFPLIRGFAFQVSVNHGPPWPENINWKIPEISHSVNNP